MRKLLLIMMTALCCATISAQDNAQVDNAAAATESEQTFPRLTGIPKPPVAGTTINMVYAPAGGPLEGMDNIVAIMHLYCNYKWTLADVELRKEGDTWCGSFDIPADCAFMAMWFQSTWDQYAAVRDNNDNKGYLFVLSDGNGQPLPGGHLAWGTFRRPSAGLAPGGYWKEGFNEIDKDALYFWYQKEIQANQDKASQFFPTMMSIVRLQTGERWPEAAEMFINIFSKMGTPSERNLQEIETIYRNQIKNEQKADSVKEVLRTLHPDGWWARREYIAKYQRVPEQWHENMMGFFEKFPINESRKLECYQQFVYYNATRAIATDFFNGQWDQQPFIDLLQDMPFQTLSEVYRSTVSPFHTKKAVSDDLNYPVGKVLIDLMLERVGDNSYADTGLSPTQSRLHGQHWLDEYLGNFADILVGRGEHEEALKYLSKISDKRRYTIPEANETEINALRALGRDYGEVVRNAYAANAVSVATRQMVKDDYVKSHGSEEGFDKYEASLKSAESKDKLLAEVKSHIINEPMPAFALKDMDGKKVSSADWKGKIVVLDFWASWCFPCKNSFPGMKQAQDRYKDDANVLFYFIDTMEKGNDYKQQAKDYMAKKGFDFNVLFDEKHEPNADDNRKVFMSMNGINHSMAIPRKMIVKDGRVRYTAEGYAGSPSLLADEVSCVIDILKAEK